MEKIVKFIVENIGKGKIERQTAVQMLAMLKLNTAELSSDIAIIGLAARYPMADNAEEFWEHLRNGRNLTGEFPESRRDPINRYLGLKKIPVDKIRYITGSYLHEIDKFDYSFFRLSPKEASLMEPSQRIFLEIAWKAVEDAGYGGKRILGTKTGVYVGFYNNLRDCYQKIIHEAEPASLSASMAGNITAMLPSRISYLLDLRGPTMVIDTACSSSLVAVDVACQALKNGSCDMAVAGGVKINTVPVYDENETIGFESPDGLTRTFDDAANGTGVGEGAAAVLLKPLKKALKDGDHIYAVIKGTAANQDGSSIGITAPNPDAQADVIEKAWEIAGISPETISFIEAHGTATELGDPIEIKGISDVFARYTDKRQFCAIGSLKTNIGHLYEAAGITGLIKAVMALKHGELPPSLMFNKPNSKIDFENSPVYILDRHCEWKTDGSPRRCGISSFGFSGTNCHVVLEEAPPEKEEGKDLPEVPKVLTLSAKSKNALETILKEYAALPWETLNPQDVCYTANTGRGHYNHRVAVIAKDWKDFKNSLEKIGGVDGLKEIYTDKFCIFYREHKIISGHREPKEAGYVTTEEKRELDRSANRKLQEFITAGKINPDILKELCRFYVDGADLNWDEFYRDESRKKVSLPTYPFERNSCWVDIPEVDREEAELKAADGCLSNMPEASGDSLFHRVEWKPEKRKESPTGLGKGTVLIFTDSKGIGEKLAAAFEDEGREVITAEYSDSFEKLKENRYRTGAGRDNFRSLFTDVEYENISTLIYLWTLESGKESGSMEALDGNMQRSVMGLYYLAGMLEEQYSKHSISMTIVSEYAYGITGDETKIIPENAAASGLAAVIAKECRWVSPRFIDIDDSMTITELFDEVRQPDGDFKAAYRNGVRYVEKFGSMDLKTFEDKPLVLKTDGVYVITGGLGGIGIEVSKMLSNTSGIKLALINRSPFPERSQWQHILDIYADKPLCGKIRALQEMEAKGAEIILCRGDVANPDDMKSAFDSLRSKYGSIRGVIHGAGLPGSKLISEREDNDFIGVLNPKVRGTWILDRITEKDDLDFFIVFSSVAAVFPVAGQGDYAAANSYMEAFAEYRNKSGKRTQAIQWGTWKETGMAADSGFNLDYIVKAMDTSVMLEGFYSVVRKDVPKVLIGNLNFDRKKVFLLEQSLIDLSDPIKQRIRELKKGPGGENNPERARITAASRTGGDAREKTTVITGRADGSYTDTEVELAQIWGEILGFKEINVYDDFFELGGDSISGMRVAGHINRRLCNLPGLTDLFTHPTISELAEYIEDTLLKSSGNKANGSMDKMDGTAVIKEEKANYGNVPNGEAQEKKVRMELSEVSGYLPWDKELIEKIYPLSPMQEGMLFYWLVDKNSSTYFEQLSFDLEGTLDIELLKRSFELLVQKYDIFRTVFAVEKLNSPLQVVFKEKTPEIRFANIESLCSEEKLNYLNGYLKNDIARGFDLSADPPLRLSVLQTGRCSFRIIFSFHHIVMDGWSIGIVLKELFVNYLSREEHTAVKWEEACQYCRYLEWLNSHDGREDFTFWQRYLKGYEQQAVLPGFRKGLQHAYRQGEIEFTLGKSVNDALANIARENHTTLNIVFEAIWGILLQFYNDTDDVVFGSVVSGRPPEMKEIEKMVGLFINTVPVRIKFSKGLRFGELISTVHQTLLAAKKHEYAPISGIQANSPLKQELFDSILVFDNFPGKSQFLNGISGYKHKFAFSNFKMFEQTNYNFNVLILPEHGLSVRFLFNESVYAKETAENVRDHFIRIIETVSRNAEIRTEDIDILSEKEKRRLVLDFNNTRREYPNESTIHELFEVQAAKTPEKIALEFRNIKLSYGELNGKANRIARKLREEGVKPNDIVAIMLERSPEMVAGIYGILKAGGAYLPISPNYPESRIGFMLEDSGTRLLLTMGRAAEKIKFEGRILDLLSEDLCEEEAENPEKVNISRDLAYVIYTSGSTGKPKGVMIEHRSLVNRLHWMQGKYPLGDGDVILQKTPYTFDVSVWELFWWALAGSRVCMLEPGAEKDPEAILDAVGQYRITVMHFVPSMLNTFLEYVENDANPGRLMSLKQVFASGEALSLQHVKKFNQLIHKRYGSLLFNLYGPTEAAVDVSYFDCPTGGEPEIIPIGKPIDNIRLYIMNRHHRLQPVGVAGELCIAGDGLARGYLNRTALTSEKFVPDPLSSGERMYKTGDIARFLPDGNIEYLGRADHQVKIRGFRIETGEIESRLLECGSVKEAVVVPIEEEAGGKYLCAYIVSDREIDIPELRTALTRQLPDYMIPARFIKIERIPLTDSGKVDRKALPKPARNKKEGEIPSGALSETEKKVAEIWNELLNAESIGLHESFFEAGGDSLLIMRMFMKLRELAPKKPLKITDIFANPTITELAALIDSDEPAAVKDFSIKPMILPAAYFTGNGTENAAASYSFRLDGAVYEKFKAISRLHGINLYDLLTAAAMYLFSEVTGEKLVSIQTTTEKDGRFRQIEIDLNGINDFIELSKAANQAVNPALNPQTYALREAGAAKTSRQWNAFVPLILVHQSSDAGRELLDVFDMIFELLEQDRSVQLCFEYDAFRLNGSRIKEMIKAYAEFLEELSR